MKVPTLGLMWRRFNDRLTHSMLGHGVNPLLRRMFRVELVRWSDVFDDLSDLVKPSATVIVDAGAHVGDTAAVLADRFPCAEVLAFEPYPDSFDRLQNRRIPRLRAYLMALGSRRDKAVLHVNGSTASNSLLTPNEDGRALFPVQLAGHDEVLVEVTTLDDVCDRENIEAIDLLKLDVQGYELEVFRGARRILPNVWAILCEVNLIPQYAGAVHVRDIDRHLHEAGFALHDIYNLYRDRATNRLVFADAVYLNNRRQP